MKGPPSTQVIPNLLASSDRLGWKVTPVPVDLLNFLDCGLLYPASQGSRVELVPHKVGG